MKHGSIAISALQLQAHDFERFHDAWPSILQTIETEAQAGQQLIVLPEGTIPAYVIGTTPPDRQTIDAALAQIQDIVDRHGCCVVVGTVHAQGADLRNAAAVLTPHSPIAYVGKRFLWHFDSLWFTPGAQLEPVPTPFGALGIIVCADGRIPTIAKALVDRGADILVVVTAWVTSGRDTAQLENIQADLFAVVRARENARVLVAANKVGCERESVLYCGKSQIVDSDGSHLQIASAYAAQTLRATVKVDRASQPQRFAPLVLPERMGRSRKRRIALSQCATQLQQRTAAWAEVDVLLCRTRSEHASYDAVPTIETSTMQTQSIVNIGECALAIVEPENLIDPAYLVEARLRGYDLFYWQAENDDDWTMKLARTRAVELRAYMLVQTGHAWFAFDPNGICVARTSDLLPLGQFVYDPGVSDATTLAPHTDILEGLRRVQAL